MIPPLPLDGLDEDGHGARVDGSLHRPGVPVGQDHEARCKGPEPRPVLLLRGETDDGGGPPVEVPLEHQDFPLILGNPLDRHAPLPRRLDRRLHRLGAGVHGEEAGKPCQLADLLAEGAQLVVAERSRRERHPIGLLLERRHDARVAVALVDGRVGGQKVQVLVPLHVPTPQTPRGPGEITTSKGVIVVGAVRLLQPNEVGC